NLFQGGAERIQTRADTWMLNGDIGHLDDVEQRLRGGVPFRTEALWMEIARLHALDGGTPMGFQPPLAPGDWRIIGGRRVEYGQMPTGSTSSALVRRASTPLALRADASVLFSVLQQAPEATKTVARLEERIAELQRTSHGAELAEVVDLQQAYLG